MSRFAFRDSDCVGNGPDSDKNYEMPTFRPKADLDPWGLWNDGGRNCAASNLT